MNRCFGAFVCAAFGCAIGMSACGSGPKELAPSAVAPRTTDVLSPPYLDPRFNTSDAEFADLPGWSGGDHAGAVLALRAHCSSIVPSDSRDDDAAPERDRAWVKACRAIVEAPVETLEDDQAAQFVLEAVFQPALLAGPTSDLGLVTAYYEPIIRVSREKTPVFSEPILAEPADLLVEHTTDAAGNPFDAVFQVLPTGDLGTYPDRESITETVSDEQVLAWGRRSDVTFLQIQGSGRLQFDDGYITRAAFAATNGLPYVSIARVMLDSGLLPQSNLSNEAVGQWLDGASPQDAAIVMNANPRYVFFRLEPLGDPKIGPVGNAGYPLRNGVSVAVDPEWHDYGALYWIAPEGRGAPAPQFALAQDKGAAIKGPLRADLFFGSGDQAGRAANRIQHEAEWWVMLPRPIPIGGAD